MNSKGHFNLPFGWNSRANSCNPVALRGFRQKRLASRVELSTGNYELSLKDVEAGDVVSIDPPYAAGGSKTFTKYQAGSFDHHRLARVVTERDRRGAIVVASHADVPIVRELYRGFRIDVIGVRRNVARRSEARRGWTEVLISRARVGSERAPGARRPNLESDDDASARASHDILFGRGWRGVAEAMALVAAGLTAEGWSASPVLGQEAIRRAAERGLVERDRNNFMRAIRCDPFAYTEEDWTLCIEIALFDHSPEEAVEAAMTWARETLGLSPAHSDGDAHARRSLEAALRALLLAD